ncbi:hypothetical protein SHIRM173S_10214 [Streptomyces hirsutus]
MTALTVPHGALCHTRPVVVERAYVEGGSRVLDDSRALCYPGPRRRLSSCDSAVRARTEKGAWTSVAASSEPGRKTVEAARRGDMRAQDELVAAHLPLVYNIVAGP